MIKLGSAEISACHREFVSKQGRSTMKYITLLLLIALGTNHTFASSSQEELMIGSWKIAPEWAGWFQPECRDITMTIAENGTITRVTGKLKYSSSVCFSEQGHRIRLDETLIEHNSELACAGQKAEKLLGHLEKPSFVSVTHDRLLYYRGVNKKSLIIFERQ